MVQVQFDRSIPDEQVKTALQNVNLPGLTVQQVGAEDRDYLLRFNEMEESPLEIYESVDMMRILEYGEKVRMVPTGERTCSVDTPEDLARVERLMAGDTLMKTYSRQG